MTKKPEVAQKATSFKKSKGDLKESDGLAASGESVFAKEHWDKLGKESEVLAKLKVKADKRGKK